EAGFLQLCRHRASPAPKPKSIHRQNRNMRVHVVAPIAGSLELAFEGLPHNHPERIAGRDIMPAAEHEFIAIRVLWPAIIVTQSTEFVSSQMRGYVERRVR